MFFGKSTEDGAHQTPVNAEPHRATPATGQSPPEAPVDHEKLLEQGRQREAQDDFEDEIANLPLENPELWQKMLISGELKDGEEPKSA